LSVSSRLYLDHAATTPIIPLARDAMLEGMERWANPSSPHSEGRAARAALEAARRRISDALNWDGEVIFTSGASEAIAIGLRGADDVILSDVEHDAVLAARPDARRLPVDSAGIARLSAVSGAGCYAIQSVNNETGVIQPLGDFASAIRAQGGIWFADCSQSAGKMPLPDADMIAISAHKLGGPPGIGALLLRDLALISPSGGQEQGYRRGTENLPAILSFAAALETGYDWMEQASLLRRRLDDAITSAGGAVVAGSSERLATISSYHMPGVSASSQLIGFDMEGIAVSAGSACSSGTLKTSHVLGAMGWAVRQASEVVRVSFGPDTSEADMDRFMAAWRGIFSRAKAA
jgi:cysteine desulfurase